MKHLTLLSLAIASPMLAQERFEAALTYDKVQARAQTVTSLTFAPKDNSAAGLAFAWYPWQAGGGQLGFSAGYRFKGSSDLVVSGFGNSEAAGTFENEHIDLGLRWIWRKPFDLGVGLQYRMEKLAWEAKHVPGETWSSNWSRPWFEVLAGYTWERASLKPFVGFSVALPIVSESTPSSVATSETQAAANQERLVRSAGPKFEMALRIGLRF
jgi:hypothetical protein